MKKILISTICCLTFSLVVHAQASGGQIMRKTVSKTQKTTKKDVKRKTSPVQSITNGQQDFSAPPPSSNIQPTPIENLSTYNVVVGTMGIISNAQGLCQSLRDKGYSSRIYWDESRKLYRIIIGSTYSEQEALSLRNTSKQTYPDAWILYIVNGKEERYY